MSAAILEILPSQGRWMPWRNGRGSTRELLIWPPGARFEDGNFDWRVSCAGVVEDGDFSRFPDHQRLLLITHGPGLVLEHGQDAPRARLRPLEPYGFDGAWATHAELLGAPVEDFGLLHRRGGFQAELEAFKLGTRRWRVELDPAQHGLLYCVAGSAHLRVAREEQAFDLAPGGALFLAAGPGSREVDIEGLAKHTVLLSLAIRPRD